MDRREFVKKTGFATLGLGLSSQLLAESKINGRVAIIGAGAAGLYAGKLLKDAGIDFQIFEASNRYGGRLGEIRDFADFPLDLGAQWMHGKRSIVGDLVKDDETFITHDKMSGEVFWVDGKLEDKIPLKLYRKLVAGSKKEDISYLDYARDKGIEDKYMIFVEQLANMYGASADTISVKWTARDERNWHSGNKDYKFQDTYFNLIDRLVASEIKDKIQLETQILSIDYRRDEIALTDQMGFTYIAKKAIITVPVTILQQDAIKFIPPLAKEKVEAFSKIGMGPGMKVFLKFKTKFYHDNIAGGQVCSSYSNENIGKTGNDNVLLAFIMGDQAKNLSDLGKDDLILNKLLEELDLMYNGQATENYIDGHVIDWTTNSFIRGAYSYSKVGCGNAREVASEPIDDKIYFAGEAMNIIGHNSCVHGAMETSAREVKRILIGNK